LGTKYNIIYLERKTCCFTTDLWFAQKTNFTIQHSTLLFNLPPHTYLHEC